MPLPARKLSTIIGRLAEPVAVVVLDCVAHSIVDCDHYFGKYCASMGICQVSGANSESSPQYVKKTLFILTFSFLLPYIHSFTSSNGILLYFRGHNPQHLDAKGKTRLPLPFFSCVGCNFVDSNEGHGNLVKWCKCSDFFRVRYTMIGMQIQNRRKSKTRKGRIDKG